MAGTFAEQRAPYIGNANDRAGVSGDMSADIVGPWIDVSQLDEVSFDMSWTDNDNPIGTFYIRGSNQYKAPADETEGVDSEFVIGKHPNATADSHIHTVNLKLWRVKWIMLWYDVTSGGSGDTLTVWMGGKGRS